jgi:hypothetical protein
VFIVGKFFEMKNGSQNTTFFQINGKAGNLSKRDLSLEMGYQ